MRLFPVFLFLSLLELAQSRPILDPELRASLKPAQKKELTVIARFGASFVPALQSQSPSQTKLQKIAWAQKTQSNLRDFFTDRILSGERLKIETLWINNSAIITASSHVISQLLKRNDILSLHFDREFTLDLPKRGLSKPVRESEDFTYGLEMIEAGRAWKELSVSGKGVTVGVIDTGYADHPELKDRVIKAHDFVTTLPDDRPNDDQGHGSHVLGTIGGGNLSGKHIGVAPRVRFIVAKIFSSRRKTSLSMILRAMQWMSDPDGNPETDDHPRIISNSWGGYPGTLDQEKPMWEIVQAWRELGILPVFAVGNSGPERSTIRTPGGYPHSLAVAALTPNRTLAWFSSRGNITWEGGEVIKPDLAAPGYEVLSLDLKAGYKRLSGTSMATPHVAGVAALMLEANPEISVDVLEEALIASAEDLDVQGKDPKTGHGLLNAYEAVRLAKSGGWLHLQVEAPGAYPSRVGVPSGKIYHSDSDGFLRIFAPEGPLSLRVESHGAYPKMLATVIKAGKTKNASLVMSEADSFNLNLEVVDSKGSLIENSRIEFQESPLEDAVFPTGVYNASLPGGFLRLKIVSMGYRSQTLKFLFNKNLKKRITLDPSPEVLVVGDDLSRDFESYVSESLDTLGVAHDVQTDNQDLHSLNDLLPYNVIIWYTGMTWQRTLEPSEQEMLQQYIQSGGRLILSGQDIGRDLQDTDFYRDVLGARWVQDESEHDEDFEVVEGQGLEFSLDGEDSAEDQGSPDHIAAANENASLLFHYKIEKAGAGLIHSYEGTPLIYLAFGIEGITGKPDRDKVLKVLLDKIQPTLSERLDRIEKAYHENRKLYEVLVQSFPLQANQKKLQTVLSTRKNLGPFRPLLARIHH